MSSTEVLTAFAEWQSATVELGKRLADSSWQLSSAEMVALIKGQHETIAQAQSQALQLIGDADSRGIPGELGASSTQAFLSGALRISPHLASEQTKVAKALRDRYPDTKSALAEGSICFEQASAITFTVDTLPNQATVEDKVRAEAYLLAHTDVINAVGIRKMRRRLIEVIDPDGVLDRDKAAAERRALNIRDNHDGTQTIRWRETDENVATVKAAMTALAGPKPAEDGTRDERSAEERRADAALEICKLALRGGLLPRQRGERPHVHITTTAETLRTGKGLARTSSGEDLSGAALRRVACDADLFAILLNDDGVPLNVGRRERTVTPGIWIALVARDGGCVFPGCTRPPYMCDAHHRIHWLDEGETSLDNTLLLCGYHHDQVHHHGWDVVMGPDRKPRLIPPAWIDVDRKPLANTYWTSQHAMADALGDFADPEPDPGSPPVE